MVYNREITLLRGRVKFLERNDAMITVYTQKRCMPCASTKMELARFGIEYEEVSVEEPGVLDKLIKMGHSSVPVVVTPSDSWSGLDREKIRALADRT